MSTRIISLPPPEYASPLTLISSQSVIDFEEIFDDEFEMLVIVKVIDISWVGFA
jgi:hypothetical protein